MLRMACVTTCLATVQLRSTERHLKLASRFSSMFPRCQAQSSGAAGDDLADANGVVTENPDAAEAHVNGLALARQKFHTGGTAVECRAYPPVLSTVHDAPSIAAFRGPRRREKAEFPPEWHESVADGVELRPPPSD